MKHLFIAFVLVFLISLVKVETNPPSVHIEAGKTVKAAKEVTSHKVTPLAEKAPEAPENVPKWTIPTSPNTLTPVERINAALLHLQSRGMPKHSAAYLVGNFISESYVDPSNCLGDGGTACGIAQWRFGRQVGMPEGLIEQIDWALDYEMPKDAKAGHYPNLRDRLYDPNSTRADLQLGFKQWERYGVAGARAEYGDYILSLLP